MVPDERKLEPKTNEPIALPENWMELPLAVLMKDERMVDTNTYFDELINDMEIDCDNDYYEN